MSRPARAVVWATAIYAVVFFALGADRYATYHSGADLGLFAQSIDGALAGMHNTFEASSHFAFHFSPILYLCAPLLWLTRTAVALVFVQAVATASIAPALYVIARRRTGDREAAFIACVALLYPPLHGVTFTDFHEVAFVPAAAAWMLAAIDARRWSAAYVLLAVLLCVKEDQAPALAFLGIVAGTYFARRGERAGVWFGGLAVAASAAVFAAYFALIRPLAGAPEHWVPQHFYDWIGYAHALPLDRQIAGRLTYLLEAFVPLAFLPLRSRVLILSLPGFAEVLASREPLTYTMGQHYAAVWVPYVLVAYTVAAASLSAGRPRVGRRWITAALVLSAIVGIAFSPLHLGHFLRPRQPQDGTTDAFIAALPRDASIGTYDEIYAHLGFYPKAQVGLAGEPQYVLMDERYSSVPWDTTSLPLLRRWVREGKYTAMRSDDGILLYERK